MTYLESIIHLIVVRTCGYLENQGRQNTWERFLTVQQMVQGLTEEHLHTWKNASLEETSRYTRILELMGEDEEEDHVLQSVLDLCVAVQCVPEFQAFLNFHTGAGVTLHLAYGLEGIDFPKQQDIRKKIELLSNVCYVDAKKSPVQYQDLVMDDRILSFLMGDDALAASLQDICFVFRKDSELHPLYMYEEEAKKATECLHSSVPMVQLAGKGGRRFLAKHIAKMLGKDFLFVSLKELGQLEGKDFEILRMELIREALFAEAGICLYGVERETLQKMEQDESILTKHLLLPMMEREISLIVCTEEGIHLPVEDHRKEKFKGQDSLLTVVELLPMSEQERVQVWKGFQEQYQLDIDSVHFAMRYPLTASEIASVLSIWRERGKGENISDDLSFSKLCYEMLCKGIEDRMGKVLYPEVKMEDLKLIDSTKELLGQVIASVNGSYQIFEEWNLKKKYAYGRAVTVLLAGPPGTGKTMSAHALANDMGIPLYQVNLSNVVDKYIGETEKHLEQAFSFAEKTSMVLFFDEADSLFGKRSEVTDAKDKYANTEVSYLLQRIEQFTGIVIMATNFINNIDPAFLRRMKYVIRFQPPDEAQRLAIWESCILPELPVQELDLPYLARQFDFSGGTIKNILLNACAIAVYKEEVLGMEHILKAIKDEYIKMERIIDSTMWGEYAYLMI